MEAAAAGAAVAAVTAVAATAATAAATAAGHHRCGGCVRVAGSATWASEAADLRSSSGSGGALVHRVRFLLW